MEKNDLNKIYVPSDSIVTRIIEDDIIIVPIDSDTVDFNHSLYSLTKTGVVIWGKLNSSVTVEQICLDLSKKYDAPLTTIQKDVFELLQDLLEKNLIVEYKNE